MSRVCVEKVGQKLASTEIATRSTEQAQEDKCMNLMRRAKTVPALTAIPDVYGIQGFHQPV